MNLFIKRLLVLPLVAFILFAQVNSIPGVSGGNAGVPGGSSGQYQYNNAGSFAGDAGLTRTSVGQIKLQDPTPTTGVTTLTVQAGAGQSVTNLLALRNAAGSADMFNVWLAGSGTTVSVSYNGGARFEGFGGDAGVLRLNRSSQIGWTSTAFDDVAPDIGLARDAAGRLRVSNGSTGLGQIMIASSTPATATATCAAGTVVWDSSYIYVCIATNTWKRAAIATW